ncbi:MAG: hypothetical protein CMQ46_03820 [Gammaproteobacteria bacterium]|nr:hypothetical protein [Gammaproteobacteria bacterium]MBJ54373.1 hypothetical protein [Gammaproteobacteria bacterium]|tara:strand:+ start:738 stop:1316 length:579 start_codon:yes stop_codon:yes gene_type:complete
MDFQSTEFVTLQRSRLILHPAAREAFDLDQRIETEMAGEFVDHAFRVLADIGVYLVVSALQGEKNSGLYGFLGNWHILNNCTETQIICLRLSSEIDDSGIETIAAAYVAGRLMRMPRISTGLAHCVELAKKSPDFLTALKGSTARKNSSAETAVANACQSSKSTVRSQVRSLRARKRRQMEQIKFQFEEIMS